LSSESAIAKLGEIGVVEGQVAHREVLLEVDQRRGAGDEQDVVRSA